MGQFILNGRNYSGIAYANGCFIDTDNVVYSAFTFDSSAHTWTATEDCILTDNMYPPDNTTAYFIRIDGKQVFAGYSTVEDPFVYVKKGQVVEYRAKSDSTMKAYGIQQGSNITFLSEYASACYDTNEREVGCWVDGKPLYQKTISVAPLPNSGTKEIQLDNDIEKIISMNGYAIDGNDNCDIFFNDVVPTNNNASIRVYTNTTTKKLYITTAVDLRSYTEAYITLQYTKTTDVVGSGKLTPTAMPTVHYSTSEQVVGTWIDGKPIYQCTWSGTKTTNAEEVVISGLTTLDTLVDSKVIFKGNTGAQIAQYFRDASDFGRCWYDNNGIHMDLGNSYPIRPVTWYITLSYTKTTD